MRSHLDVSMLVVLSALGAAAAPRIADAQLPPAIRTRHYSFLPRASVLNQQGGFAGVDVNYRVTGTFDFITTPSLIAVSPPVFGGDFENVVAEGKARNGDIISLDDAINLTGLEGSSGFPGPSNVFRMRGETADGSKMELWAALRGPWMYMRGGTTPPVGGADFFEYRIRALARQRPLADFNDDGVVDGADLVSLSSSTSDFGADFLAWQQQFGETPPPEAEFEAAIAAATLSAATSVPEPATLALINTVVAALFAARRPF